MKTPLLIFSICLVLFGCRQEDDVKPVSTPGDPTAAFLIFPYENSECNEGTIISSTQSSVLFEWTPGEKTDEFELILTNIFTGDQASYTTLEKKIPIILQRGTPYAWYIISKSFEVAETAQSETWKFYNAAEGIKSYAPFPAEIVTPLMAETITSSTGEITLEWNGIDVDNDIVGYDVYFDTTNPPDLLVSDIEESILTDVQVTPGTIYYWSITTKDAHGNSSESGVYQFKVL